MKVLFPFLPAAMAPMTYRSKTLCGKAYFTRKNHFFIDFFPSLASNLSSDLQRVSVFLHCLGAGAVYSYEAGTAEEAVEVKEKFEKGLLKMGRLSNDAQ